jgi:FKBP-type peptidyl-prolyl cis-trans isomerase SlyD
MQVGKDKVVYFQYSLSEVGGDLLEESGQSVPVAYLHGHRNILPALEAAMGGREEGERFSVTLSPEDAYGYRRDDSRQRVPIKHLLTRGRLRPGMAVKINTGQGARDARIIKVGRFNVDVDTNHPLAGLTLKFDIHITGIRDAEAVEIAHGHVHGEGGHQH